VQVVVADNPIREVLVQDAQSQCNVTNISYENVPQPNVLFDYSSLSEMISFIKDKKEYAIASHYPVSKHSEKYHMLEPISLPSYLVDGDDVFTLLKKESKIYMPQLLNDVCMVADQVCFNR
jgi:hypothetical protein